MQQWVAGISVLLLLVKFWGYYLTHSVAILTDAFESIVNVASGFIGLYSLYISAKPRDKDHPYGHGRIEFISAGIEGTLIVSAGALVIYKAVGNLLREPGVQKLDYGIALIAITAVVNFLLGYISTVKGRNNNSPALVASGRHMMSDSYSTFGIILGLLFLLYTGIVWIDSVIAVIFAGFIIFTGYRILRSSVAGMMDEADIGLLNRLTSVLNKSRRENWVDLHNLRIIKYGSILHLDCHLTVPWYLNVHEAHAEIDALSAVVKNELGDTVELFVHSDGCLPFSCKICSKANCRERQYDFEKAIVWSRENIIQDKKHQV